MRIGRSIPIAVILTATVGVSVAMAVQSARESATVDPGEFGTPVATCPGGTTAISGGFAAPGFDPQSGGATLGRVGSKRVGSDGIETRALNFGNAAGDIVSFAYCAAHGHGLRVRSDSVRVDPETRGSVVAKCPGASQAVGGGFSTYRFDPEGGPQVITLTSKRHRGDSWKVVAANIPSGSGPSRPGTLVGRVYCAAPPFDIITNSKTVTAPNNGVLRSFDVPCPKGSRALSGGFDGHVNVQGPQTTGSASITSRRADGGSVWRTKALSIFGNQGTVTGYVYCRQQ